tara:strand:+ start:1587 stop:2486 length:900 start_codon:yes stop_codon:yes gene_type:complete
MSPSQLFNCPDCSSEIRGTTGATLICATCTCQFIAEAAVPVDEVELTLAPLDELPTMAHTLPPVTTGTVDTSLHLEEEISQPDRPCKKCNELMKFDAIECPHCGFNITLGRNFDPAELDPYHGVYGFDRYLMRHTQDNNTGGLMLWLHIFLGFVAIGTMLVWKGWLYFIVPTLVLVYIVYRVKANYSNAFQRGKGLIPGLLLLYNRVTTWKGFVSGGNPDNGIVSMRTSQFNDNSIASIEEPQSIEILDIAGSAITDNGIRFLATFSNLRVLVVAGCSVGEQALDDLQAALPRVCIWRP